MKSGANKVNDAAPLLYFCYSITVRLSHVAARAKISVV